MEVLQLRAHSADASDDSRGRRYSKCIELRPQSQRQQGNSLCGSSSACSSAIFAAESPSQHAKWLNSIESCATPAHSLPLSAPTDLGAPTLLLLSLPTLAEA